MARIAMVKKYLSMLAISTIFTTVWCDLLREVICPPLVSSVGMVLSLRNIMPCLECLSDADSRDPAQDHLLSTVQRHLLVNALLIMVSFQVLIYEVNLTSTKTPQDSTI